MEKKWNLQDIKPAPKPVAVRKHVEPKSSPAQEIRRKEPVPTYKSPEASPRRRKTPTNRKTTIFLIAGAVLIILLGFGASLVFGGAVVEIEPKQEEVNVDADFTAHLAPSAEQLGYELLTLEATSERQVTATGKENVSLQAEGMITIYNAYSDTPQRLIKNTRFESPDGLIFRIFESVEVPGRTQGEGGSIVPGSITARVFADAPGEQYNIGPTRFVVPGLRGSDQFESIYAESSAAFSGGFEGERHIIADGELQVVQEALHKELEEALRARLGTERPAGFVLFDDAVTFTFASLPSEAGGNDVATIKEQGKLVIPIFKQDEFASYIARNTIAGYNNEKVLVENSEALQFSYQGTTTPVLGDMQSIDFSLTGNARIVWQFDEAKLKDDLLGTSKTALPTILGGYPAIQKAEAVIKPFWKQSFPEKSDEITFKILKSE
jgi:hypothetical protein